MALTKPDARTQAALWRLRHSEDGNLVIQWLAESLREQDINNRMATGESVGRGQGKSLVLDELIDTITSINPKKL